MVLGTSPNKLDASWLLDDFANLGNVGALNLPLHSNASVLVMFVLCNLM